MAKGRHIKLTQQLEKDIVSGVLKPGSKLDEARLAEQFSVSRTPIREALIQLSSSGLVELRPGRGAVVATIDLKVMLEMFEVMAELEGMCGRLAARRASLTELEQLEKIHQASLESVKKYDLDAYYHHNLDLHGTIYTASRNGYLINRTQALRNRLAPYRRGQLLNGNRIEGSFAEHGEIIKAIKSRDTKLAEKLLREHVMMQGGTFNDFIASLPSEFLGETMSL